MDSFVYHLFILLSCSKRIFFPSCLVFGGLRFYNLVIAWHETSGKEDFPGKIWRSKNVRFFE